MRNIFPDYIVQKSAEITHTTQEPHVPQIDRSFCAKGTEPPIALSVQLNVRFRVVTIELVLCILRSESKTHTCVDKYNK